MIDDRMTEEKLADSEILERLIYKAFVSPEKFLPHDTGDALLTFAMAMRLYHRICAQEIGHQIKLKPSELENFTFEPGLMPEFDSGPVMVNIYPKQGGRGDAP